MKFIHISDLHIGKRLYELNLLDDQRHIFSVILSEIDNIKPDGVILTGDIYDKSIPSAEAVSMFDDFLSNLAEKQLQIFIVSGNHDSADRLNFGSRIMSRHNIHIAGIYEGGLKKVTMEAGGLCANIYLMPFVRPELTRPYFADSKIETYDDAVRTTIEDCEISPDAVNILVAHQFITGGSTSPILSESESTTAGGLDNIDFGVFEPFDYVALGHLHRPQFIGREQVRYAGSPLKYSFSESTHEKSMTLLEITAKNACVITAIPIKPLRDLREIKGPIDELIKEARKSGECCNDYIRAILTDENEIFDAMGRLRQVYPNALTLILDNKRSKANPDSLTAASGDVSRRTPMELFREFFRNQNNDDLSDEEVRIMEKLLDAKEGESA